MTTYPTRGSLLAVAAVLVLASCSDDNSSDSIAASGPTSASSQTGPWLRIANLSADLDGAQVRLDGRVFRDRISYPNISPYRRIDPGMHRIRFVPPEKTDVDPRTVELETTFTVGPGGAVTTVSAGLVDTRTLQVVAIPDELTPSRTNVRIRLIHAMTDFPSPLGLWKNDSTALVRRVELLEDAPYRVLEAGNHPLEVRRTGTAGPLLPVIPYGLASNATYTMFAFGTLRRDDLDARLVIDASQGVATLRR